MYYWKMFDNDGLSVPMVYVDGRTLVSCDTPLDAEALVKYLNSLSQQIAALKAALEALRDQYAALQKAVQFALERGMISASSDDQEVYGERHL